jgi:2-C-methyl-D-erythritol 2,4-cyclodiphosphate synthase
MIFPLHNFGSTIMTKPLKPLPFRDGQGFDVHALVESRPLIIGGVLIPYAKGLAGHSDADVLLHAVTDALLGAIAAGDIGQHFPDTDARFKGADSRVLLRHAYQLVLDAGYVLGNLDATIIAQAPKMAPHIIPMRQNIAADLQVDVTQLNVKAKTSEQLGYLGRGEGIACDVVVLLYRNGA